MKLYNSLVYIIILSVIVTLLSACLGNASFSEDEYKFVRPFSDTNNIVIYKSSKGQTDTVLFSRWETDTIKYRSIEQGYYNENVLSVNYELSNNSFHKITVKSINNEPDHFLFFGKAKNSYSNKEICFLGLLFDKEYLENIISTKDASIVFSRHNAKYSGLNINQGIKSFTFDFNKGVVSFIDDDGVDWVRIN